MVGYDSIVASDPWVAAMMTYACTFTNKMAEVIASGSPWSELYDVYRFFALARIMVALGALRPLDQNFLYREYSPDKIQVPAHFPNGTATYDYDSHYKGDKRTFHSLDTVCGGVNLSGTPTRRAVESSNDVRLAGRMALEAMKSCNGPCWDLT
jgi:hypothetical protein